MKEGFLWRAGKEEAGIVRALCVETTVYHDHEDWCVCKSAVPASRAGCMVTLQRYKDISYLFSLL